MTPIEIPYGRGHLTGNVPEKRLLGIFRPRIPPAAEDAAAEVRRALDAPINSPKLEELARGRRSCVIIASDHTRPVPSRILMPQLLERLRRNNPSIAITILIATGFHRASTRAELVEKFGEAIVARERIVVHDSRDASQLVEIGTLPSGGRLVVNKLAVETDLLISEGFIEPHFFAGFSGGRKSVLPGIASAESVMANHCAEFIASPGARAGSLDGNPIHRDMCFAAECARLAFILNVVIDPDRRIVRAFAGAPAEAHTAGCAFLSGFAEVQIPEADIAVTGNGGYPLDQNLYQAVKGMTAAEAATRPGGVIVMAASCSDGAGGEAFRQALAETADPAELWHRILAIPRNRTRPDQWEYQILARILMHRHLILVTRDCDPSLLDEMHVPHAATLDEALQRATGIAGPEAKIAVIPDGVSAIVHRIPRTGN